MTETDETELALAQVAADIIESISMARAMELAAGLPGRERVMGPREHEVARHANPDYARLRGIPPLDPGAEKWCSYCGNSKESELVPGPDHEHGFSDWMCKDSLDRHCQARHERRWPPMPEKAEPILMKLARMQDDAAAARQQWGQPHQQEHEPADRQDKPAGQQAEPPSQYAVPPGWQFATQNGVYDVHGTWHPPVQLPVAPPSRFDAYAHTLMNPAHRAHLLSGQPRPHYYGGPHYVPPGVLSGQEGAQAQHEPEQGRAEVPPERLTPAQAAILDGATGGSGDIQMIQPKTPEGAPKKPARRPGRRSYYRGSFRGR